MNENEIRMLLRQNILEKAERAFEMFLEENSISQNRVSDKNVVKRIAEEQENLSIGDFMQLADKTSGDEMEDQIKDYVDSTFDEDYLVTKIEEKIDTEDIFETMREELVFLLIKTEPYAAAPKNYWYIQSKRVHDIKELSDYVTTDGLERFIERYATDWEEVAEEA